MSQEQPMQAQHPAEIPSYVHMFQKAHQNIGMLEQIDEQLAQLWARRTELQQELRSLQTEIDNELEQWIHAAGEPPKQILSAITEAAKNGESLNAGTSNGGATGGINVTLPPLAQRANPPRFATQPLASPTAE